MSTDSGLSKLSEVEGWLYRRIQRGGVLGDALPFEILDHDARVRWGDEIMFTLVDSLTKLREDGYIRRDEANPRASWPLRKRVDLQIARKDKKIASELHQCELVVRATNVTTSRIDEFYMEVELPLVLIDLKGERTFVVERSTQEVGLFRTPATKILPGDSVEKRFSYQMNSDMYHAHRRVFGTWRATARAYLNGELAAETELKKIQIF